MFLTTQQVLTAYIRTGLKPLWGEQAFAVDAEGQDLRGQMYDHLATEDEYGVAVAACPIGVMCIAKNHSAFQVESGSFGEHYYCDETHAGNGCWTDGFIAGWEETEHGKGYGATDYNYTIEETPEGLALYQCGYGNGQHIRKDFIRLGLRQN